MHTVEVRSVYPLGDKVSFFNPSLAVLRLNCNKTSEIHAIFSEGGRVQECFYQAARSPALLTT